MYEASQSKHEVVSR